MKFLLTSLLIAPLTTVLAIPHDQQQHQHEARQAPSTDIVGQNPTFTFNQLLDLQKKFFDNFIYPADAAQAKAINSTLLAEDVQGRIDITRTFSGRELNTEYLFGLFANLAQTPDAISLLGVPLHYEIVHFAASNNTASALTRQVQSTSSYNGKPSNRRLSSRFLFNFTALDLIVPVEIDSWNTYNSAQQISQYDATFKYWQWTVDYLLQQAQLKFKLPTPAATVDLLTGALAKSICTTAMTYCNGTNAQYQSATDCSSFLTTGIRFGQSYELGSFPSLSLLPIYQNPHTYHFCTGRNTLLCRMVHQNMVPFRPEVHCPHIGKTGGGFCNDDKTYPQTVMENFFTNSPFGILPSMGATGGPPGLAAAEEAPVGGI